MPDIQLMVQLDQPVDGIRIHLQHPSLLLKYLMSEALHLAVVPDFLKRKDQLLSLGPLIWLHLDDVRIGILIGDLLDIADWADAMTCVGALVRDIRRLVENADPACLAHDNTFKQKRDALQHRMAEAVARSKTVFHEPWGMVSMFWAAGSPATACAKAATLSLMIEKGAQPKVAAA